jgi:hypothetical protein
MFLVAGYPASPSAIRLRRMASRLPGFAFGYAVSSPGFQVPGSQFRRFFFQSTRLRRLGVQKARRI